MNGPRRTPRRGGTRRRARSPRKRGLRLWPGRRLRQRWWRAFRRTSGTTQLLGALFVVAVLWLAVNGVYQVIRKPSELFFPVSGTLNKTPPETWREYGPLFRRYSTAVMSAELLAALAQVEGSGNPVARTYWRWSWTVRPFELYRPASSAVGMYQITDGTFAEARHYCIRHHEVLAAGRWDDWQACWFNDFYARVLPGDAIELTSAYLDRSVAAILQRNRLGPVTLESQQSLATLIHLCGAGAGEEFARRGLRLRPGERCGDHEARVYLAKVMAMKREFEELAARP